MATQMQIAYFNATEAARHNRAQESLTSRDILEKQRHNVVSEDVERGKLGETTRHNFQTERQGWVDVGVRAGTLAESQRHNLEMEKYNYGTLAESVRHNKATENVQYGTLQESYRHNLATEDIGQQNIDLGYGNLGLGYANVNYNYAQLAELTRHNVAQEGIQSISANAQASQAQTQKGYLQQTIREQDRRYWMDAIYGGVSTGTEAVKDVAQGFGAILNPFRRSGGSKK